jgi:hypothetical protein
LCRQPFCSYPATKELFCGAGTPAVAACAAAGRARPAASKAAAAAPSVASAARVTLPFVLRVLAAGQAVLASLRAGWPGRPPGLTGRVEPAAGRVRLTVFIIVSSALWLGWLLAPGSRAAGACAIRNRPHEGPQEGLRGLPWPLYDGGDALENLAGARRKLLESPAPRGREIARSVRPTYCWRSVLSPTSAVVMRRGLSACEGRWP